MTTLGFTRPNKRLKDSVKEAEDLGFEVMAAPSLDIQSGDDAEFDRLDTAFDSRPDSRLACQVKIGQADLVIEIPVHNRNIVGER